MKRFIISIVSVFVVSACFLLPASTALAESSPFQLSLTPDIAIQDRDTRIEGLSLGIWSENPQEALTLGFVSGSTGESVGFSWSFLLNYADSYKGVHWAPVNYTKDYFFGWQSGFVNYAREFSGLQWGFVNFAETADTGLQIGLVNVIKENAWFKNLPNELAKGMVIVNWRF